MKNILLLTIILLGVYHNSISQYTMSNTTVTACNGTFLDPGGAGNYANNQVFTMTFCSGTGQAVNLDFTAFALENNWDYLYIYDGTSTASPTLGTFTGTNSPGLVSAPSGCITVRFTSDGSITAAGFEATISCGAVVVVPTTNYLVSGVGQVDGCTGTVYDPGGTNVYANNQNFTRTFCSGTGDPINLNFTQFVLENNFDYVYLYDGPTIASPLIGTYTGSVSPGSVTASSGCITVRFTSDISITYAGFAASISCITNPCTAPVITANGPTSFCSGGSVGLSIPPSGTPTSSDLLITVSGAGFLDEVSWTLTNSLGAIAASGGPYALGSTNNVPLTLSDGPFVFNIESQGTFDDNTPTYTVNCVTTGTILATGTLTGGSTFTSGNLACGGASGVTNVWSPATGLNVTTGNNVIASPTVTTTYTVTSTEASSGCVTTDDITITVTPGPVATASPNSQIICSGQSTNIALSSVPAGATYNWTVAQSGVSGASAGNGSTISQVLSLTGLLSGTANYTITPTIGGCVGTPITVTIIINPQVTPTFTQIPIVCTGGTLNLPTNSLEGIAGIWSPAANTAVTTNYTFTPAAGQCASTAAMTVAIGDALDFVNVQNPPSINICEGNTATIYGQVYELGLTEPNSQAPGIVAEYGVFNLNTDPSTWPSSAWSSGTYNPVSLLNPDNDEYMGTISGLTAGTYYFAFRFSLNGCNFQYGGYSAVGGGFWGGANVNGVITVLPITVPTFTQIPPVCFGAAILPLPNSSLEGITGTWNPLLNSTTTTTYTFTPSAGECASITTMTIVVNPTITVIATPASETICSGLTTGIDLSSNPAGATFSWTVVQTNVTGGSAGNGSSINQNLSNLGSNVENVTYTITPTLGTCVGTPLDLIITVEPSPIVIATPALQTLCSGGQTNISLTTSPLGGTFDWTVSQTGVSGAIAGTGSTISQTLTALGQAVGTATYTVTPTLNGCLGTTADVVMTVNPIPTALATPAAQTLCSGDVTGISLSSTPAGATFDWTVNQIGTMGATAGNGNLIAQTIDATSTNSGSATYTVTPTFATCVGVPLDVVISINANPIAIATPSIQTICEGTATSITLSSNPAGAAFSWTVAQIGATGAFSGNGSSITQTLDAIGTVSGTVTYTITPISGSCSGLPIDVVITVNPTPVALANLVSGAICSGTATNIALTSSPAGASFDWTVLELGTSGASAGNGNSVTQILNVSGLVSGTTTYTVTPTLSACAGLPIDIPVTVNPTPVVSATPISQTICSTTAPSITLSSTPMGAGFSWTVSESGTSGASAASGFTINQSLSATGTAQGTATYSVIPTLGACIGSPLDVPIFVNPIPVVTATPSLETICSLTSTGINLSSSPAGATFDWTVLQSNISGASDASGNGINQVLSSTSTAVGTATYTVTPTLNGCVGSPIDVVITVNPIPTAIATPASQTICSGDLTSIALTSSPVGSTFGWTVTQSLASGATAGAIANIAQVLNATTSNTGTVTYNVTPTLNACVGSPIAVVISVAANPVVTATPASQTICEGTSTGIVLSSSPTGATYNWTSSETNATGSSAGTGANIAQVLDATALVAGTVTYTINSNIGACVGLPVDVIITVNPRPTAISTPVSQTICATTATSIDLTSSPVGSTFGWTVSESGTSGATPGAGSTIAQTLGVTGLVAGTTTYSITPTLSGCAGSPLDVVVTVDPTPTAIATPTTQTICSETAFTIDLSSSPVGSTFGWTVAELGETGGNAGTGSTISEILTVTGITQGTATYTVTPTLGVCVGLPINVPILVNPIPVVTALAAQDTICSATSNSISMSSVPAGASFAWTSVDNLVTGSSAGSGNNVSQVLSSTSTAVGSSIYTITPTLTGCVGLPVDVEITVNPLPTVVATPSDETLCSGETSGIVLTSSPAGSTFNWTVLSANVLGAANGGGDTIAQTLTSTVTGTSTYTITPTLNGCTGPTSNVVVTVNPNPTLITNIGQGTLCIGSSISMDVSGAVNYDWTPATGLDTNVGDSVVATPLATQTYFVTGTDINNCSSIDSIAITVNPIPVTTVTFNDTICEGLSINLNANGADSYAWTPSTGLNSITDSSIVASPLVTTTYTVTGTSLNCSSTATVTVYVKPAPTINAGVDSLICYGNSIVLSGSGAVSYAWSGGVVDNVPFFPTSTQTYTVVGTAANQCQDSDQVVVSITPLPIIDLVPSITSGCVPQAVDFQNNTIGASVYNWDFGDSTTSTMTNPSHNYTSIGCYDITLTASTLNGCTFTTTYPSMVCVELTPVASFYANPSQVTTDYPVSTMVNTSQDAVAYSWDFGDGTGGNTDFMPVHTFPGSDVTTYTVELVVYSLTGCTDTARVNLQVYEDIVYFVPNAFTPDDDSFNQTFKPVFTSGYDPYDYSMFIYNRWGQVIFESHDASVGWDGTYGNASGIVMDGTYVWTIEFKVTQTSQRKKIEGHVNVLR